MATETQELHCVDAAQTHVVEGVVENLQVSSVQFSTAVACRHARTVPDVRAARSMKLPGVRPSVCLSVCPSCAVAGLHLLLWVSQRADDVDRLLHGTSAAGAASCCCYVCK